MCWIYLALHTNICIYIYKIYIYTEYKECNTPFFVSCDDYTNPVRVDAADDDVTDAVLLGGAPAGCCCCCCCCNNNFCCALIK